jgi:hypothetical protein
MSIEAAPTTIDWMDVAVNLVESYLRLNGYLTLSEIEVQSQNALGGYDTLTDVDIIGFRFPGDVFAAESTDRAESRMLLITDDVLDLDEDRIDVIIGEVKQGEAVFNAGLGRTEVLQSVLRRLEWVYADGITSVVDRLRRGGISHDRARGGGEIRTRLVAFGQSPVSGPHTIPISHVIEALVGFMERYDDVLRSAQFKEPATALIRLLVKAGFTVGR